MTSEIPRATAREAADCAWSGHREADPASSIVWADTLSDDVLTVEWLVKGLIERQSLFVIYGPPKTGKTFAATDLGLHIATGRPWFDLKVPRAGLVIYVAGEGIGAIRRRVIAHAQHHGLEKAELKYFGIVTAHVDLLDSDTVEDLYSIIKAAEHRAGQKAVLIVIDTLARAMPSGDHDKSRDMGAAVASLDRLRDRVGAAIGIIHHSGKDETRGMRGSNALLGAVDLSIVVSGHDSGVSELAVDAQREGDGQFKAAFQLLPVALGTDDDGDKIVSCVIEPTEAPERTGKPGGLPKGAKIALEALKDELAKGAGDPVPGLLGHVLTVSEDQWRKAVYQRSPDATPQARQKAFVRAEARLIADGIVAKQGSRAWLVADQPKPDNAGHP